MERTAVTISDAAPHNWNPRTTVTAGESTPLAIGVESSVDFVIGPGTSPVDAMQQAAAMVALALPRFLEGAPEADEVCAAAQAVLTELVDVTARHRAGDDLVGRVSFDGLYVTVSVGDMAGALPAPEDEPGLFLVHRLATVVRQHAGTMGGLVTWAAVPVRA
jgi:hypothetical protein